MNKIQLRRIAEQTRASLVLQGDEGEQAVEHLQMVMDILSIKFGSI